MKRQIRIIFFIQSTATEGFGERGLTRLIMKQTDKWSDLKSLITVVVIGKDKFYVKVKSIIEEEELRVPKCMGYQMREA